MIGQTPISAESDAASQTPPGPSAGEETEAANGPGDAPAQVEIGGRPGPDPTRYGDWEKNGRCIDF